MSGLAPSGMIAALAAGMRTTTAVAVQTGDAFRQLNTSLTRAIAFSTARAKALRKRRLQRQARRATRRAQRRGRRHD